jgi:hypothetical protein
MRLHRSIPSAVRQIRLDGPVSYEDLHVIQATRAFRHYAEAVLAGRFSAAIAPHAELAAAGFEILYQRRRPEGGRHE